MEDKCFVSDHYLPGDRPDDKNTVLGSNLLIFGNLVWIMIELYRVCCKGDDIKKVELIIARYLPVYALWTIFVTFGFPLIFGMK